MADTPTWSPRLGSLVHDRLLLTEPLFQADEQYSIHTGSLTRTNLNRKTDHSSGTVQLNVRNNDDVFDHAMSINIISGGSNRYHDHHTPHHPGAIQLSCCYYTSQYYCDFSLGALRH
jgi:hypothetical protein